MKTYVWLLLVSCFLSTGAYANSRLALGSSSIIYPTTFYNTMNARFVPFVGRNLTPFEAGSLYSQYLLSDRSALAVSRIISAYVAAKLKQSAAHVGGVTYTGTYVFGPSYGYDYYTGTNHFVDFYTGTGWGLLRNPSSLCNVPVYQCTLYNSGVEFRLAFGYPCSSRRIGYACSTPAPGTSPIREAYGPMAPHSSRTAQHIRLGPPPPNSAWRAVRGVHVILK